MKFMGSYDKLRQEDKPMTIRWLFVAESPPPPVHIASSRHFYRVLKGAGFKVLNQELIDYPGQFNQRRFREKVQAVMAGTGWQKSSG
jgi:hypothetical protein